MTGPGCSSSRSKFTFTRTGRPLQEKQINSLNSPFFHKSMTFLELQRFKRMGSFPITISCHILLDRCSINVQILRIIMIRHNKQQAGSSTENLSHHIFSLRFPPFVKEGWRNLPWQTIFVSNFVWQIDVWISVTKLSHILIKRNKKTSSINVNYNHSCIFNSNHTIFYKIYKI